MENVNALLATNISEKRKASNMTQEELAEKLGVTFQAVSKWENAKAAPDISLFPKLADIFKCSIDALFSRSSNNVAIKEDMLPWENDDVIRGAVFKGRILLKDIAVIDRFTFEVNGDVNGVSAHCNLSVNGDVSGGCIAGGDLNVAGDISGGCCAERDIVVGADISGGCCAERDITVGSDLMGGVVTKGDVVIGGDHHGDISADGDITVSGDVEAETINGDLVCASIRCYGKVNGEITEQ